MTLTYYISISEDTYVKTYFAKINDTDPKYGFKRVFMDAETYDFGDEWAYEITISQEGLYEQSIKVFSKKTGKLIRRERKYFEYEGSCLYEIERGEAIEFISVLKELATL